MLLLHPVGIHPSTDEEHLLQQHLNIRNGLSTLLSILPVHEVLQRPVPGYRTDHIQRLHFLHPVLPQAALR